MKEISASTGSIGATGFVKALPADVRQRLLNHGQQRKFAKGQIIQQRGDPGTEFWYIKSGSVQIGRYSIDGKLILFALLSAGESFGEQAFLGEFPRMVDAIAGTDCTLIRVGEAELQDLISSEPKAARILLKTMAHTLQEAFDMLEAGRNLSTKERLAQVLMRLCGDQDSDVELSITQQELADLVGVSRVSLGKALASLERRGWIVRRYGSIHIVDWVKLKQAVAVM